MPELPAARPGGTIELSRAAANNPAVIPMYTYAVACAPDCAAMVKYRAQVSAVADVEECRSGGRLTVTKCPRDVCRIGKCLDIE